MVLVSSMTGYGRFREVVGGRDITVEVKSVNHRYYDYSSRIPRIYGFLDDYLKPFIQQYMSRGKVDVSIWIESVEAETSDVVINHALAENYIDALKDISKRYEIPDGLSATVVSRFPDVISVKPANEEEEVVWNDVRVVLEKALERFVEMRKREGESMKADILMRASAIADFVSSVEELCPQIVSEHMEKMKTRIAELLSDANVDEQRLLTEAAIFADKTAVDEEIVRLRSHLEQLNSLMNSDEPVGRKLDFLVQEINREANTIGSKSQDIKLARLVVDIKAEIEKIREQIQNVE